MATRRGFLGSAAGAIFCGCSLINEASAQAPRKLPVTIRGRRIKTVDVHAHCLFQNALDVLGAEAGAKIIPPTKGAKEHFIGAERRLAAMDGMGIDMEVLSINPFWYGMDREVATKIVALNNEGLAKLCSEHPDRFAAFASLTLQFPELAVEQLQHAVKKLGLKGAAIGGSVQGEDFYNARFHPVWAKAEELGVPLFIHPQSTPQLAGRFKGNGWLSNTIGNPLDTTIALQHLIFEGTLDKFPGLKIIGAHGGGFFGSYAPRSDHACFVSPQNCNPDIKLKKKPTEYLKQLYFDTIVFTPEALRHLVAEVGASQVLIGTDHPIPWEEHPVDLIMNTKTLNDREREMILSTNAKRLFGIS